MSGTCRYVLVPIAVAKHPLADYIMYRTHQYDNMAMCVCVQCQIGLWSVAQAYVYFEKLALKVSVVVLYCWFFALVHVCIDGN